MTPRERRACIALAVFIAATRLLAVAASLWDWDEVLFCLGMREYDVAAHHPHPPGFPVYVGLAKAIALVTGSEFRALQAINVIASMLVFPAIFVLARELGLQAATSMIAGALFAFFPNVWFFGGTAFSDVPSVVLVVFAAAMLLRGRRDRNAYWLGALLLGLAIGIRPQNALVGFFPALAAMRNRKWHETAIAIAIGGSVVAIAFGAAAMATGSFERFLSAINAHGAYIARTDSFRAPGRPPLWRLVDRFFIKQYQWPLLSVITSVLVVISVGQTLLSVLRRTGRSACPTDRAIGWNALIFGPFAIFAWLMLDRFSISRFSIAYQPMFAILAADGIARVGGRRAAILGSVIVAAFIGYTLPSLEVVRKQASPPVRALQATRSAVRPSDDLFVSNSMVPYLELMMPRRRFVAVMDHRGLPLSSNGNAWLLAEGEPLDPEAITFRRDRGHLWNIARRRYFETVLAPFSRRAEFVEGWYAAEGWQRYQWRWMGKRSVTRLPRVDGEAVLRLRAEVPGELLPVRFTIRVDGRVVDDTSLTAAKFEREYETRGGSVLEISVDRALQPGPHDPRELGLRLEALSFGVR